ncbi:MAG: hypothetical protein QMC80_07435 [Thermoplasmatales archaeon]|nr:hypothetical protein [Thermoplasmatales archaeon]
MRDFVKGYGKKYSEMLGIDLKNEPFKWFLASMLFGARITEKIAVNTYKEFGSEKIVTPKKIIEAGWDRLVRILDKGGYVRYDFKTADKLLEVSENLIKNYGNLDNLHEKAINSKDLEDKLKKLGKGVGEVTAGIFLREMRSVWEKARPAPRGLVLLAAKNLGIKDLENYWRKNLSDFEFSEFETALMRLGKDFCRKKKCSFCPLKKRCPTSF